MGMYTELIFGASIRSSIPDLDLAALKYLLGEGDEPSELPNHEFFMCDRWKYMTRCSSYYFAVRNTHRSIELDKISDTWLCSSRSNLKNYDSEIEKFLSWIKPFIEQGSGERDFYAIVCYEEASEPTIYYLDKEADDV